jgi:protein TonB
MTYIYEPEIEEEDSGYSIPKILVAVLLLVVIGAGAYIYYQQKKITNSIAYLLNAKKQVEQDLNEMIEKYNLAIEDNDFLADELRAERDRIIRYRDSIKNVKGEDFKNLKKYEQQIRSLKENSAIVFEDTPIISPPPSQIEETTIPIDETTVEEVVTTQKEDKKPQTIKEKPKKPEPSKPITQPIKEENNDIASTEEVVAPIETDTEKLVEEIKKEEVKKEEPVTKPQTKKVEYTNFVRVETPPTYPGCKGSATEKKACFTKKVKSFVGKKFNADIITNLNIESGKKRIWVSFDVDKFGNIIGVNAKAPKGISTSASKALENEAERVVRSLPKMTAARQNGNPVKINYSVPITFIVP